MHIAMKKTIVFFDIDGTIWDYSGFIPESAKRGIKLLKEEGHIPVICTGRSMGHVRDENLLNIGFSGIIAGCGTHVEYEGKMLYEYYLSDEITKRIVSLSKEFRTPVVLEGRQKHWMSSFGFKHDDYVDRMKVLLKEDAVVFEEYLPEMKINKFAGDVILASDFEGFKRALPGELELIYHELGTENGIRQAKKGDDPERVLGVFEVVEKGCSKAHGMRVLCEHLGVDIKDTFAFGDSNNDIEMVEAAGVGIAMGNSSENLLKTADYVTDELHMDGLYNALVHFGLIKD